MAFELVIDQWPIVFTRFDGAQSLPEFEDYIRRVDAVQARRQPYVNVIYLKAYSRERAILERIARWMKDTEAVTRQLCVASALINNSVGFRFVLSSIFLIKAMPVPYQVCSTFEDATTFVRRHASERGLLLPSPQRPWPDLP